MKNEEIVNEFIERVALELSKKNTEECDNSLDIVFMLAPLCQNLNTKFTEIIPDLEYCKDITYIKDETGGYTNGRIEFYTNEFMEKYIITFLADTYSSEDFDIPNFNIEKTISIGSCEWCGSIGEYLQFEKLFSDKFEDIYKRCVESEKARKIKLLEEQMKEIRNELNTLKNS